MLGTQSRRPGARWSLFLLIGSLTLSLVAAGGAAGGPKQASDQERFSATALQPTDVLHGAKSRTARIVRSDRALLQRTDSAPVNVIVKLDYDSIATYRGGVRGLKATSPAKTGKALKKNARAVRAYERHIAALEARTKRSIRAKVPAARVYASFRTVYGGLALRLPANQARKLLNVAGVVAVQRDHLRKPLTDATPAFLGADQVWPSLGGSNRAGEGVIVGVLDTGIWPNHPSFEDPGISAPAGSFSCEFGDGTNPDLGPAFDCNDKLIGAYAFVDTYMAFIDALPGEFCDNATNECSARDADGHGTHTASTAAGSPVDSAPIFGIERGPISGIAPGAHVIAYRVCLDLGCFESDSVVAIEQAIDDGVDVVNFSISGGASPYTDPVEIAFLEAYDNGILVNASAGNSGPDAATADHAGPWTNTVGASTSDRHFLTTLNVAGDGGTSFEAVGSSVTPGVGSPTPVVRAEDIGGDEGCLDPFPAAAAVGKVVVCVGSFSRNLRAFNVFQAGGEGMILHAITKDLFTDNFWVPTVMLPPAAGDALQDFLDANTGETAHWDTGVATPVQGDVMTNFSSRGPLGDFIKPDVTAPGMEILAGTTPDPHDEAIFSGPPGEHFQAISGTSMSSPHSAGVSALVKAAHPNWTPGQIKSALMTSSVQSVLKEDGATAADPFDRGAGSIRANRAVEPTVTFNETTAAYIAAAGDPLGRIHLNLPSVNAPTMPGIVTTTRTMRNVSGRPQLLHAETTSAPGTSITVSPRRISVPRNGMATIRITIDGSDAAEGQYFGQITLDPVRPSARNVVLPVAFFKQQGAVTLTNTCSPTTIPKRTSSDCQVKAENLSPQAAEVDLSVRAFRADNERLVRGVIRNVSPPGVQDSRGLTWSGTLSAALAPEITGIVPGGTGFGFVPLGDPPFNVPPISDMGDETIANFTVPAFKYGSETYTSVGMVSNGYAVVGGGTAEDVDFVPQTFPDAAPPNNVLAPFWTDLDLSAGGAMRLAVLGDGTTEWIVLEWEEAPVFSNHAEEQSFQIWLETAATAEGVSFEYGLVTSSTDPVNVGAENRDGSSGVNLGALPTTGQEYSITTSPPTPGGNVTIDYDFFGIRSGVFDVVAAMTSNQTPGVTVDKERITVTGG